MIESAFSLVRQIYTYGFSGFGSYFWVGAAVGAFIVLVMLLDCRWGDFKTWNWNVGVFMCIRFLCGALLWPLLLFVLPLIATLLALLSAFVLFVLLVRLVFKCRVWLS